MTESQQLLGDYAKSGSEAAFRELVTRYIGLVYATARRLTGGNDLLAEDVAQTVFVDLARQARTLPRAVMLGGWLHRHTCFVASKALRGERRRQNREQEAVAMNTLNEGTGLDLDRVAPALDDAINQLGETDRQAILLRFFEQHDLRAVGEALGASENAAQKRVARALEELRGLLQQRGITSTTAALTALLAGQTATAAPSGLALTISSVALAGATTATGGTLTILKTLTMTKLKTGLIGAVIVAVATAPLLLQNQIHSRQLAANETALRRLTAEVDRQTGENERLAKLLADANGQPALSAGERGELLRLRGEVASLRERQKQSTPEHKSVEQQVPKTSERATEADASQPLPKDAWRFVGYATPETAFQSVMWAMHSGDVKAFLDGLTPEAREKATTEWAGRSESEVAAMLKEEIREINGLRLDRKRDTSDTETSFVAAAKEQDDGAIRTRDESIVKFRKVGGLWKFTGL